jgi:hypothetical protein
VQIRCGCPEPARPGRIVARQHRPGGGHVFRPASAERRCNWISSAAFLDAGLLRLSSRCGRPANKCSWRQSVALPGGRVATHPKMAVFLMIPGRMYLGRLPGRPQFGAPRGDEGAPLQSPRPHFGPVPSGAPQDWDRGYGGANSRQPLTRLAVSCPTLSRAPPSPSLFRCGTNALARAAGRGAGAFVRRGRMSTATRFRGVRVHGQTVGLLALPATRPAPPTPVS